MECFTLCSLVPRPPFGVLICCCLLYLPYLFLYNYIATNLVIRSPFLHSIYVLLGNYCYSSNNKQLMIIFYTSITQHAHVCTCTYYIHVVEYVLISKYKLWSDSCGGLEPSLVHQKNYLVEVTSSFIELTMNRIYTL